MKARQAMSARSKIDLGLIFIASALVVAFANTWIWPRPDILRVPTGSYLEALTPSGSVFFGMTWVFAAIATAAGIIREPTWLFRVTVACVPLLSWAVIVSISSFDQGRSLWFTLTWALTACSGAALGVQLPTQKLVYLVTSTIGMLLTASVMGIAAFPAMVQIPFESFSGLFIQKQILGWTAVVFGLVVVCSGRFSVPIKLAAAAGSLFLCVLANSMSAIIIQVIAATVYGLALPFIRRSSVAFAWKVALLVVPIIVLAVVGTLNFSQFVSSIDREENLSGRVYVWAEYLRYTVDHEWFGLGPGAFSSGSPYVRSIYSIEAAPNWWQSTHSVYLLLLGEVGYIGILLFAVPLLLLAFVRPLLTKSSSAAIAGALSFQLLVGGGIEPTEGTYPTQVSLSIFLILAFHAAAVRRNRVFSRRSEAGRRWGSGRQSEPREGQSACHSTEEVALEARRTGSARLSGAVPAPPKDASRADLRPARFSWAMGARSSTS